MQKITTERDLLQTELTDHERVLNELDKAAKKPCVWRKAPEPVEDVAVAG